MGGSGQTPTGRLNIDQNGRGNSSQLQGVIIDDDFEARLPGKLVGELLQRNWRRAGQFNRLVERYEHFRVAPLVVPSSDAAGGGILPSSEIDGGSDDDQ